MLSCSISVLHFPGDVILRTGKLPADSASVVTGESSKGGDDEENDISSRNGGIDNNGVTLYVGVFGDTAGAISVWLLPGSIVPSKVQVHGTVRYVLVAIRHCLPLLACMKLFHPYRLLHSACIRLTVL